MPTNGGGNDVQVNRAVGDSRSTGSRIGRAGTNGAESDQGVRQGARDQAESNQGVSYPWFLDSVELAYDVVAQARIEREWLQQN